MTPINYIEKGSGLWDAIGRAGLHLAEINGVMVTSSDPVQVQAVIDGYTLDQAKAYKSSESLARAKALRDKVVASISPGEMASWSIKRMEAIAYATSGDASKAPMLAAEAAARGISLTQMLGKVSANSNAFAALEAAIGGADGRHRDLIAILNSFEAVSNYDLSVGWPEV